MNNLENAGVDLRADVAPYTDRRAFPSHNIAETCLGGLFKVLRTIVETSRQYNHGSHSMRLEGKIPTFYLLKSETKSGDFSLQHYAMATVVILPGSL